MLSSEIRKKNKRVIEALLLSSWKVYVFPSSPYFNVPEDMISRGACYGKCCAPGLCLKNQSESQPLSATVEHKQIKLKPSWTTLGAISWPWLLQSQIRLRGEASRVLVVLTCLRHLWTSNSVVLSVIVCRWNQKQSCFWAQETSLDSVTA